MFKKFLERQRKQKENQNLINLVANYSDALADGDMKEAMSLLSKHAHLPQFLHLAGGIDEFRRRMRETKMERTLREMQELSEDERYAIILTFCRDCGSSNLPCMCWRDE